MGHAWDMPLLGIKCGETLQQAPASCRLASHGSLPRRLGCSFSNGGRGGLHATSRTYGANEIQANETKKADTW
jgi:hypothetical protein